MTTFDPPDLAEIRELRGVAQATGISTAVVAASRSRSGSNLGDWPLSSLGGINPSSGDGLSLVPCYTWKPGQASDAVLEGLLDLDSSSLVAFRCRPSASQGDELFEPWLAGAVPAVLADIRRPLIVDVTLAGVPPYGAIFRLSSMFPTLPVILALGGGEDLSTVRALARSCPNVLVETSGLPAEVLHDFALELGAGRLVFGSGYPEGDSRAALARVERLRLDTASTDLLLHQNAEALLTGSWTVGGS